MLARIENTVAESMVAVAIVANARAATLRRMGIWKKQRRKSLALAVQAKATGKIVDEKPLGGTEFYRKKASFRACFFVFIVI